MTHQELARAICCPSGTCCSPGACYAHDRTRSHLVDIHAAAAAVQRLYCDRWREWTASRGPMSATRVLGDGE